MTYLYLRNTDALSHLITNFVGFERYEKLRELSTVLALYRTHLSTHSSDCSFEFILDITIEDVFGESPAEFDQFYYESVRNFVEENYTHKDIDDIKANVFFDNVLNELNDLAIDLALG